MTIQQAIEKAEEGGYKLTRKGKTYHSLSFDYVEGVERLNASIDYGNGHKGIDVIAWSEILLDPLFWQYLYRSEEYGRIKAIEFINAIFDGKSAEKFFEQE